MNNEQRAELAFKAVQTFTAKAGLEGEDMDKKISDLLCNLQHLAEEQAVDFNQCLERASKNYHTETKEEALSEEGDTCPHCKSDLTNEDSITREYVNKDDDDSVYATGHYKDSVFESDSFGGFGEGRFDLHDDSDKCSCCQGQL